MNTSYTPRGLSYRAEPDAPVRVEVTEAARELFATRGKLQKAESQLQAMEALLDDLVDGCEELVTRLEAGDLEGGGQLIPVLRSIIAIAERPKDDGQIDWTVTEDDLGDVYNGSD